MITDYWFTIKKRKSTFNTTTSKFQLFKKLPYDVNIMKALFEHVSFSSVETVGVFFLMKIYNFFPGNLIFIFRYCLNQCSRKSIPPKF